MLELGPEMSFLPNWPAGVSCPSLYCIAFLYCVAFFYILRAWYVVPMQVTVSTVGLVDELEQFQARSKAQLAVSLHATTDEVRDWIVPVNRRHNLAKLMGALQKHYPRTAGTAAAARGGGTGSAAEGGGAGAAVVLGGGALAGAAAAAAGNGKGGFKRSVRRVLIEYTMLKDINDTVEDAER